MFTDLIADKYPYGYTEKYEIQVKEQLMLRMVAIFFRGRPIEKLRFSGHP